MILLIIRQVSGKAGYPIQYILMFYKADEKFGQSQSGRLEVGKCVQYTVNYRLGDLCDMPWIRKSPFLLHLACSAPGIPSSLTLEFASRLFIVLACFV